MGCESTVRVAPLDLPRCGETSASSGLPQTTLKSPDEKGVDDDYYYRKSGTRTITDIQPSLSPVSIVSTLGCLVTTLYGRLGSYT